MQQRSCSLQGILQCCWVPEAPRAACFYVPKNVMCNTPVPLLAPALLLLWLTG
jgi:hypothetical protein